MILNTLQEQLEIIQAAIDGKTIQQYRKGADGNYRYCSQDKHEYNFDFRTSQYRVKPVRWPVLQE